MSSLQGEAEAGVNMFYRGMLMPLRLHPHHGAQGPDPEPASIITGEERWGHISVQHCREERRAPTARLRSHYYQHFHPSHCRHQSHRHRR